MLELDVFRGFAALLMILNHSGNRLLAANTMPAASLDGILVFIGAFAPVLFFFATGFGIGLSAASGGRRHSPIGSVLWKAVLLVAADQFFFWRAGERFGIDFFSFIGIATFVTTLLARSGRPSRWAVVACGVLLALRYVIGPRLHVGADYGRAIQWLLGVNAVENVSYPCSPWMVYPLTGFVLGRLYGQGSATKAFVQVTSARNASMCVIGCAAVAAVLWWRHYSFFRWGTMSAAYFVLSCAVLAAFGIVAVSVTRASPALSRWLALRGVASFCIIPIHYAFLEFFPDIALPLDAAWFVPAALVVAVSSWLVSARVARFMAGEWVRAHRQVAYPTLLASIVAFGALASTFIPAHSKSMALVVLIGQLSVAALLGMRASTGAVPLRPFGNVGEAGRPHPSTNSDDPSPHQADSRT